MSEQEKDARVEAAIEAWFSPCQDIHDFKARMTRAIAAADAVSKPLPGLDFMIEKRGDVWVIDWSACGGQGCRDASAAEVSMWRHLRAAADPAGPDHAIVVAALTAEQMQQQFNAGREFEAERLASRAADAAQASAEGEAGLPLWIGGKLTDEEIRDLRACVAAQVHRAVLTAHPAPAPAVPEGMRLVQAFDAAIAAELPRVSHVAYDSHEICKHFAGEVRKRLLAAAPEAPAPAGKEGGGKTFDEFDELESQLNDGPIY